jgi:hypothetical protein
MEYHGQRARLTRRDVSLGGTMRQIMESERGDLRRELQFLKDCQFKYFSLAITATGVILGIL